MSNAAAEVSTIKTAKAGHTLVKGRVINARQLADGGFVTKIIMPAHDEYSHPETVEVKSANRLGQNGEDVQLIARLGGWVNRFRYTDKTTGRQEQGEKVILTLVAI